MFGIFDRWRLSKLMLNTSLLLVNYIICLSFQHDIYQITLTTQIIEQNRIILLFLLSSIFAVLHIACNIN